MSLFVIFIITLLCVEFICKTKENDKNKLSEFEKNFKESNDKYNFLIKNKEKLDVIYINNLTNKYKLLNEILNKMYMLDKKVYFKNEKVINLVNDFDKDCDILINVIKRNNLIIKLKNDNESNYKKLINYDFSKKINDNFLIIYKKLNELKKDLTNEEFISKTEINSLIIKLQETVNEYDKCINEVISDKMVKYGDIYKSNKKIVDEDFKT